MSGMALPILDLCNRLIALARCLSALRNGRLPGVVARQAPGLATEYRFWQNTLWKGFHQGLVGHGIIALALNCRQLVREGRSDQGSYRALITRPGAAGPTICALCDGVVNQLAFGASYIGPLQRIASQSGPAAEADLAHFRAMVTMVDGQLDAVSEGLTEGLLAQGGPIAVAITNIGLAGAEGSEEAGLLLRGAAQVGLATAKPAPIPVDTLATMGLALEWWAGAGPALRQAAQLALLIDRLVETTAPRSSAMDALAVVRNDCRQVRAVIDAGTSAEWATVGLKRLADWADAMAGIEFAEPVLRWVPD
ncbi:hypothetical protein [Nitrospirillum amazonense]|uniref:hypothetical protein n=1 Tax=Nitrospirillum amazonense TaxID=28077 RepID=UPI0024122BCF|nr:hypothetical protein [Nitrospirillum amazonense]MDG3439710.1 hypothetical protein [Nitrospirillum amazonense]